MDLVREKVGLNSADNCLNVHVKRMETLVSKKCVLFQNRCFIKYIKY